MRWHLVAWVCTTCECRCVCVCVCMSVCFDRTRPALGSAVMRSPTFLSMFSSRQHPRISVCPRAGSWGGGLSGTENTAVQKFRASTPHPFISTTYLLPVMRMVVMMMLMVSCLHLIHLADTFIQNNKLCKLCN